MIYTISEISKITGIRTDTRRNRYIARRPKSFKHDGDIYFTRDEANKLADGMIPHGISHTLVYQFVCDNPQLSFDEVREALALTKDYEPDFNEITITLKSKL